MGSRNVLARAKKTNSKFSKSIHAKPKKSQVKPAALKKISPTRKPDDMSLEEWQAALRRNFSFTQKFRLESSENTTDEKPNPYFTVRNLLNDNRYELEVRGLNSHDNYCSCPDYQINTLGTCKHIEYALRVLQKKTTYKSALLKPKPPRVSEVVIRYGGPRKVIFRPTKDLDAKALKVVNIYFLAIPSSREYVLREKAHEKFSKFVNDFESSGKHLRLREDALQYIAQLRDQTSLQKRVKGLFPNGIESDIWKTLLKSDLYRYQKEGALFAAQNGRSMIADEMGLGKTIQAIAASEILAQVAGIEKVLIVTPTSLKHQWKSEIGKFSNRSVEVIEGFSTQRRELMQTKTFFKITNYDVVRRDLDSLNAWEPDLIILDEAQRIKNWKTSTAKNVKKLKSEHCLVLTGTPLENRVEELHSLVEFVDRFHFGPLFRFLSKHQNTDETGKVIGYRNLDQINESLQGILLRRSKAKVLTQLPPRIEKTFFVPMTREQMDYHNEYANVVAQIVAKWKRHHFLSDADQKRMMSALQSMRMSCNSTFLLDRTTRHQNKITELFKILDDVFESANSKAVIFSQWLRTHELIIEWAQKKKMDFSYFHGSLDGMQRKKVIEKFMTDPKCRLFLSTDAGGVGLNLQKANVVINMDQPWNPAILEQRIGRSHRLGQNQSVQVFNLVSQGTIEEGMLKTLAFKKSLFSGVLDGGQKEIFLGGSRLTKFMESVEEATSAVPASMGAENLAESDRETQAITLVAESGSPSQLAKETSSPIAVVPSQPKMQNLIPNVASLWEPLLQIGLQMLQTLAASTTGHVTETQKQKPIFETDEKTGQVYFKVPAPSHEKIQKFAVALQELLSESEAH